MRMPVLAAVSAAALLAIVGCSSTPAATPPGQTQAPGGGTQVPGGQTQAPVGLTGHECDAVPTFSLDGSEPSFPTDDALNAHFPAQIDGQPVTDVESMQWIYLLCMFGGQETLNAAVSDAGGLNLAAMSFGSAKATVDGEEVDLNAFRAPGGDANSLVQSLALLAAQSGSDAGVTGSMTTATIGGKNVYVFTDSDGSKSYGYASGDTLIFFEDVTDSQAAKIAAALL